MSKHVSEDESFGAAPHERPVPRISIHAFCEYPDTGAALQRAAEDRRLSKAHLTVQLGGIAGAVAHYDGQVTPNLLIVETRLNGQAALEELDRLAEACDAATKVIVIGRVNDIELYRELMRRGASEYLVAPLAPLQLIEIISGLYTDRSAAPIGMATRRRRSRRIRRPRRRPCSLEGRALVRSDGAFAASRVTRALSLPAPIAVCQVDRTVLRLTDAGGCSQPALRRLQVDLDGHHLTGIPVESLADRHSRLDGHQT